MTAYRKDDPLQPEKDATLPVMGIVPLSFPLMPGEYYRRQATRVRYLALDATTPTIKDHVASVALQYEKLAEGAEAGCHDPQ